MSTQEQAHRLYDKDGESTRDKPWIMTPTTMSRGQR